ncbi:MAG: hypothetical protein ACREM8_12420, partial [Vulcanimicrobiaceae bacterium]
GILGARFAAHGAIVEAIGTWISIVVLIIIAVANLRQLSQGDGSGRLVGVKTQFLPRSLRETGNPLLAIPVGFLFGFGFETSSQVAAYTVAFGSGGVAGALLIGAMFCLGMIASDTLDSVLVHRLVSDRSAAMPRTVRVWIWSVTVMALVVAAYELAQVLGWRSPVPDIAVSGSLVAALLVIFAYVFFSTKRERCSIAVPLGGPIARGEELP